MRLRNFWFTSALILWLSCALLPGRTVEAQIKMRGVAKLESTEAAPADALIATTLALNLCVDGSAVYPCPSQVTTDNVYIPAITLTYGQILDGVVAYGAVNHIAPTAGTITIFKDADPVCYLAIGINNACPPNSTVFDAGFYTLTATLTFPPGSQFAASTAAPVTISILKDTSSIALTSSASPAAALGTAVTFRVLATGGFPATPTGQVVFIVDGTAVPAVPLDASGASSFTTSTLSLGMHTITASYAGALDFLPAADASIPQQIVPPPTATTIASSLNPSNLGDNVAFTAIVSTTALGVAPGGAVTFKDGTSPFATVLVTPKGGQNIAQSPPISTLSAGTHSITAMYSGDAETSASISRVLAQQVDYPLAMLQPGYTLTVTPSPVAMVVGETAQLTVTVTPLSGFLGAVVLTCGNLPNESACIFGETTIPAGGGTTTLALSTTFPHACRPTVAYGLGPTQHGPGPERKEIGYTGAALAGVLLLLFPRRIRGSCGRVGASIRSLLALIVICAIAGLAGCASNCTDFGTTPGGYTIQVNGSVLAAPTSGNPASGVPAIQNVSTSVAVNLQT